MYRSDAIRILKNLDKIIHFANGGDFHYQCKPDGIYFERTSSFNLQNLDHYIVIEKKKPRFKFIGYKTETKPMFKLIIDRK